MHNIGRKIQHWQFLIGNLNLENMQQWQNSEQKFNQIQGRIYEQVLCCMANINTCSMPSKQIDRGSKSEKLETKLLLICLSYFFVICFALCTFSLICTNNNKYQYSSALSIKSCIQLKKQISWLYFYAICYCLLMPHFAF